MLEFGKTRAIEKRDALGAHIAISKSIFARYGIFDVAFEATNHMMAISLAAEGAFAVEQTAIEEFHEGCKMRIDAIVGRGGQ